MSAARLHGAAVAGRPRRDRSPAAVALLGRLPDRRVPHRPGRGGRAAARRARARRGPRRGRRDLRRLAVMLGRRLHELVDPIQSQYREFFIVVGARYQGQPVSRCVYIWVDKDFAMYRGWIQGFPKKLGSIHMTRLFAAGKATPKLSAGARFGATCAANDRQIARMAVTLEHVSETGPTVNDPPMHNTRHFPAASGPRPTCSSSSAPAGATATPPTIWEGSAELALLRRHAGGPAGDRAPGDAARLPVHLRLHGRRRRRRRPASSRRSRMRHVRIEHDGPALEGTLDGRRRPRRRRLRSPSPRSSEWLSPVTPGQDHRHPPDLPLARARSTRWRGCPRRRRTS